MHRHLRAPRARVYAALTDAAMVQMWRVPNGMRSTVHEFESRENGRFRISLTYDSPDARGKSSAHTDTYHGRFVTLVPDERVVEVLQFDSDDPAMAGEMTVTYVLADASDGGTDLDATHEGVPDAVPPADNELGWRLSLDKLAALVER